MSHQNAATAIAQGATTGAQVVSLSQTGTPARQSAGLPAGSPASPSSGVAHLADLDRGGPTPRSFPDTAPWRGKDEADCGYVDVLTDPATGAEIGYRLVGRSAGPVVVVAGLCPSARRIFDRLMSIPTLPWMRGTLVLLRLDALEGGGSALDGAAGLDRIDRTIVLPWTLDGRTEDWAVLRTYHAVLRACTQLGMIAGRGVPRAAVS